MKEQTKAFILVKCAGLLMLVLSIVGILVFTEQRRLAELSLMLFNHQELFKNLSILLLFAGVFFLFYSSSKIPEHFLKLKLFKGEMKTHPEMIKKTLEQWFLEENLAHLKLMAVHVSHPDQIGIEIKTHNLDKALISLTDLEFRLQIFLEKTFGLKGALEVQLFEL